MPTPLLFLNEDLLIFFFASWLDVRTLGIVDTAFTNSQDRLIWLRCLSSIASIALDDWYHDHSSMRWFLSRGIRTNEIRVKDSRKWQITEMTFHSSNFLLLISIDVSRCLNLLDSGLSALARGCPQLQTINLGGCKTITDIKESK